MLESKLEILNPKPRTLHPKPSTLNPKPQILNPVPQTQNPNRKTLEQVCKLGLKVAPSAKAAKGRIVIFDSLLEGVVYPKP